MKNGHSYLAAFDLDKTILSVNSSRLVVKASRKMGLMSARQLRQAILYSVVYQFDLKDPNEIVLSMMKWLKGLNEKDVAGMATSLILPLMLESIRPEILDEIARHRDNNAYLLLLSSAMPYLCNPVAEHLKLDEVLCSSLETKEGVFTGRSNGNLVFGREKARQMISFCNSHNFDIDTAWYYGDAYTDRFILRSIGNPVCVKPEIKLGLMARRKGWKII
ncbi:MAG: HAD-IB family phosphatase [Bacteroidales bacterium]|nr:HAD-IB family phosphatase [Bacteroidales bacterium]